MDSTEFRRSGTVDRMPLKISVLADRPDLLDAFHAMASPWPEFMRHDPMGVPRALAPVRCVVEHDSAVYVEPNVWIRHSTR